MKVSIPSSEIDTDSRPASRCSGETTKARVVGIDHSGNQPVIGRLVADHAELEIALDQPAGNLARQTAAHLDLDAGISLSIALDMAQQIQGRRLVRADDQPAGRVVAQFRQGVLHLALQVLETPRIFQDQAPGIGQKQLPPGTVDQLLAQLVLQALHHHRNRRLRAEQLLGRP
jgi:hypothetical protein